jgi:hypothetical protein
LSAATEETDKASRSVIVELRGGLGNQMFQYATGRRLALTRDAPLVLDPARLPADGRSFDLALLHIEAAIRPGAFPAPASGRLARLRRGLSRGTVNAVAMYEESGLAFDERVLNLDVPVMLRGYWQSARYFDDIRERLRDEFRVRSAPDATTSVMLAEILDSAAVAIHVRRGDMASNPEYRKHYGICGPEYFRRAAELIRAAVPDARFFAFSDDLAAARVALRQIDGVRFVERAHSAVDDLRLMNACRHYIISNSTFGWWGAWLTARSPSMVIAPTPFANTPALNAPDIIPAGWTRIPR